MRRSRIKDYRSANQVFWQNIRRLRGKQTSLATFIEDSNGVQLEYQKGIRNSWREYFCELLNPVTVQYLETSEEQIGEEIRLTEAELTTAIKFLKAGEAPGKDDMRPEMLKAMNNFGICWLTRVFQVAWKTDEVLKQWQTNAFDIYSQKR